MAPDPESEYDKKGLLAQAQMWDEQATLVAGFAKEIGSLTFSMDGGRAFSECIRLYEQNQQELATWTGQGVSVVQQITSALAMSARKYGASEEEINKNIKNIGGRGTGEI